MTQPAVTVYRKPDCVACDRTKLKLDKAGVEYTTVDITTDTGAYKYVTEELGFTAAPVVYVDPGADSAWASWSGYRPDLIKTHITNKQGA